MSDRNAKRTEGKKIINTLARKVSTQLMVLFVMSIVILMLDFVLGLCSLSVTLGLTVYEVFSINKHRSNIVKYIERLSFYINGVTKDSILHFPEPMVIVNLEGKIIWYNKKYADIFPNVELFEKRIQDVMPSMQFSKLTDSCEQDVYPEFTYADKTYTVLKNLTCNDGEKREDTLLMMYFIDKTEDIRLRRKYDDESLIDCIIMIDNYEEVLQNTPGANHTLLMGDVEEIIRGWVDGLNGVMRKYERDKYWALIERKSLTKAIDAKFDILDIVREINAGNKIPVTLSIGIGKEGKGITEKDKFAVSAIDMALGRGGDQVVIKDGNTFHFYGAKSREVEKRTKVKARVVAHALRELTAQVGKVIIMGHKNADMDSVGASIGLFRAIHNLGNDCYIVVGQTIGRAGELFNELEELPEYQNKIITPEQAINIYDLSTLVILVDTHRPSFAEVPDLLKEPGRTMLIDHHRRSEEFLEGAILTYHEPYASSTSEMVTEMLQYIQDNIRLNRGEAQALYSGIILDTKNFTFKTGVRTFEAASYLRRMGVDTVEVYKLFQRNLNDFVREARIISAAEIYRDNIAVSTIEDASNDANLLAAQAADELLSIKGIKASFVLGEMNGKFVISGRSFGDINVQVILEKLGGGGHQTVAGAQILAENIRQAKEVLKGAIDDAIGTDK